MRIIEPHIEIESDTSQNALLSIIERAGRVCYKSENKITDGSAELFVKRILKSGHESVIEHASVTVRIVCDRGVSHEIVRHRIASYSQESTRYCNYYLDKFSNELTFIKPCFWSEDTENYKLWLKTLELIEQTYLQMIINGAKPQEARSILPNSLKTEIFVTMNIREWRHFFRLRTSRAAHPQMRQIAIMIYKEFINRYPILFNDLIIET